MRTSDKMIVLALLLLAAGTAYSIGVSVCLSVCVVKLLSNHYSSNSFSLILVKLGTHDL